MIRLYLAADPIFRSSIGFITALHQGFWLGWYGTSSLQKITGAQYSRNVCYQDSSYNGSGLRAWELAAVQRFFKKGGSVLIAAAGGGRELLALHELGFKPEGFDCVDELVETARVSLKKKRIHCRIVRADPGRVPDGFGQYDGIIVGWGGYMHIPGQAQRIEFLRQLRKHVAPRGPVLLSFFTRSATSKRFALIYRLAKIIRAIRLCSDRVEKGDTLDATYDHYFTREELCSELKQAGFELLFYSDKDYSHAVAVNGE